MWSEHPIYSALRVTAWGLNRAGYLFGWGNYYNPYPVPVYDVGGTVIDYSEPLVSYAPMEEYYLPADPAVGDTGVVIASDSDESIEAASDVAPASDLPPDAVSNFESARLEFKDGNYEQALTDIDQAIASLPKDAVLHEFRSLTLFALGRYRESTAAIHAVLAVGPGWNWTTMSGLYRSTEEYTKQLRALEQHARDNTDAADDRFLLAYHYMTLGHIEPAKNMLNSVLMREPKDTVAADMMRLIGGEVPDSVATRRPPADSGSAPSGATKATEADLLGSWASTGPGEAKFALTLTEEGEFSWEYTSGSDKQQIKGVFVVDDGVLAMEPDSGGVMLANVWNQDQGFRFDPVGSNDPNASIAFGRR